MIAVELLPAAAATDRDLVARLVTLINVVYEAAEDGVWLDGGQRTTTAELAERVGAGEIAVARVDGEAVGTIRLREVAPGTGEFGMLAADSAHRGIGVGRALIDFAERLARHRGLEAMQLELLVPRAGTHPSKVMLDAWYRRLGYVVTRRSPAADAHPELVPELAVACDFLVYTKPLR
jgi:GNAT superfamily N-acetyltransferase